MENIWLRHFISGGTAGATSRTLTAPLDRVKIYTQVNHPPIGMLLTLKQLIQNDGILNLWRGNTVNVLKIVPESAIKFTAYEKIKRLMRVRPKQELNFCERFLAGSAAGGIAQTIIFPLDVVKVRMVLGMHCIECDGIWNTMKHIYLYEGVRSLYRGYLPNILGSVPYVGIEFTIYESLKRRYTKLLPLGDQPSYSMLTLFISIATLIGQCCVYPMSLLRTRYQAGLMGNARLVRSLREIYRNDGIRGLYRGLTANICKVVPAVALNFIIYEYMSRKLGVHMS